MQSWKQMVDILTGEMPNVFPGIFYEVLTKLAEPDFAEHVKCIDAEKSYTTTASTPNYEMPLGVVDVKVVAFKAVPLKPINLANLGPTDRYHSDGTTIRTGTPWGYFFENDQLHLLPAPTEAANLRINYYTLPTYGTKKFRALADSSPTVLYLDLAIGQDLTTDTVTVTNDTRSLSANISAYTLTDDLRHKYTVAIAAQAEGDIISLPIHKYVPMIPEIYTPLLIAYARAHGYNDIGQPDKYLFWMSEYERKRDLAAIRRPGRAYPDTVFNDSAIIR